jgi:hypothetical protein
MRNSQVYGSGIVTGTTIANLRSGFGNGTELAGVCAFVHRESLVACLVLRNCYFGWHRGAGPFFRSLDRVSSVQKVDLWDRREALFVWRPPLLQFER